jgi:uncharacterized protein (TIGR02996 family)
MTHEEAFLQEILENRDDDTPRLIYADWLLDRGDPTSAARGEFIHIQCTRARWPEGPDEPAELKAREQQLLEAHRREWGSPFQRLGCRCWEYRRGFVEGVGIPASDFISAAATLFRSSPVRSLKLYEVGSVIEDLAAVSLLSRISTLDLEGNNLGDLEFQVLTESSRLENVTTLLLWSNRIGDGGLQDLVAASGLERLEQLDLSGNVVGDEGIVALAGSPLLGRLKRLDLTGNQVRDAGALALAGSPHTGQLARLDLAKNPIGAGAQAVLRERFGARVHVW